MFFSSPGTPAFLWEKEKGIPKKEKKTEKNSPGSGQETQKNYHRLFLGEKLKVLVESVQDGMGSGYSENYIPVRFGKPREGEIVEVTIEKKKMVFRKS